MNYTTGNLLIKRALSHFPPTVDLNYKKIIIFSSYEMIARTVQFNECLQNSQLIELYLIEETKKDNNKVWT